MGMSIFSTPRWDSASTTALAMAIANAVVDALSHLGVENMDIPITPYKVWQVLKEKGAVA